LAQGDVSGLPTATARPSLRCSFARGVILSGDDTEDVTKATWTHDRYDMAFADIHHARVKHLILDEFPQKILSFDDLLSSLQENGTQVDKTGLCPV